MKIQKWLVLVSIFGLPISGPLYAHSPRDMTTNVPHVTISFRDGSSHLSERSKEKIRALVMEARRSGAIDDVTVAAWSDKEFPMEDGERLHDADRGLAESRATAISSFLKNDLAIGSVETFNMADYSNWLTRNFGASHSELSSSFAVRHADVPLAGPELKVLRRSGGASEAVIVLEGRAAR